LTMNKRRQLEDFNRTKATSTKARREIMELQRGIYDKPMALEMQKEYALVAYINSEDLIAASVSCGVPVDLIGRWAKAEDWETLKHDHYEKVRMKTMELLDTTVAEQKSKLSSAIAERAMDLVSVQLNDYDMSELDRAKATKDLIDSFVKLTGESHSGESEQKQIDGVSAQTQQIFFNMFQQNNEEISNKDDEQVLDVEVEELIDELIDNDE